MFVVTTVFDTIRIPPLLLSMPTVQAVHSEIDQKYPNRVLMDVGLVVGRYGECARVGHGFCVSGDGGAHHECEFRLIVFRPFVEEVCLGRITKSTAEGIHVSIGFFVDIFIPAYWMLRPSHYEEKSGLWIWTPKYDDDEEDAEDEADDAASVGDGETIGDAEVENAAVSKIKIKAEDNGSALLAMATDEVVDEAEVIIEEENRYEMDIGSEIRFKVKSINFTQITNTAKGMQATTTTTSHSRTAFKASSTPSDEDVEGQKIRRRSSSVGLDENQALPPSMHIVASICEDGLGLTTWWAAPVEDDDDEDMKEEPKQEEN
jgi:DNA-directed RNA polymerase III subunit RPC8